MNRRNFLSAAVAAVASLFVKSKAGAKEIRYVADVIDGASEPATGDLYAFWVKNVPDPGCLQLPSVQDKSRFFTDREGSIAIWNRETPVWGPKIPR